MYNENTGNSTLAELRWLMSFTSEMGALEIEDRFEEIAKLLFEKTAVKTSDKIYLFKEIGFSSVIANIRT